MTDETVETVGSGPLSQVTEDGMAVVSNNESKKDMEDNFAAEAKPLDGAEPDLKEPEKKKQSKAAAARIEKDDLVEVKDEKKADPTPEISEADRAQKAKESQPATDADVAKAAEEEASKADRHKGQPKFDPRAKVMETTRKLAEEREKNRDLEARVDRLEAGRPPGDQSDLPPVPPVVEEKPLVQNFEVHEDFVEAMAGWTADQKIAAALKKAGETAEKTATVQRQADIRVDQAGAFNERIFKAQETDPDLLERLDPEMMAALRPTSWLTPDERAEAENDFAQLIFESENAVKILEYLTEHPEEREQWATLRDSFAVNRAMGALETRVLGGESTPKPAAPAEEQISQAKPPVKPVSGSPQHAEEDADGDTPFDDFVRIGNARDARVQRGR